MALAASRPAEDYLGIEVHRPGVGHLMLRCEELAVRNLRIICRDAVDVLEQQLPPACLDEVLLYFPDPWPKKRHHKRRIVQDSFVALVASRLRSGGMFRLATDWQPYADWMLETLGRSELAAQRDHTMARGCRDPRAARRHASSCAASVSATTYGISRSEESEEEKCHEPLPLHAASAPRMPSSMN